MKTFGIILIVLGAVGVFLGSMMFGDIGIAAFAGAIPSIVTGVGFLKLEKILAEKR